MTKRQTPPGRKSKLKVVVVKPNGPHHCARCFGSVQVEKTSARGAANSRVPTIARGSCSRSTPPGAAISSVRRVGLVIATLLNTLLVAVLGLLFGPVFGPVFGLVLRLQLLQIGIQAVETL